MKYIVTHLTPILFLSLCINTVRSQVITTDTTRPQVTYNNGFDVIIKKNGDIIYGLVKEVGLQLIKYQRTDVPDGPIYTIPRIEVYAISYRNQVKDILAPVDIPVDGMMIRPPGYWPHYRNDQNFFQDGVVHLGIGFFRSFTKVKDANEYSSSGGTPVISIGYDVFYRNQVRLGAQLAFGTHKFSRQEYSDYDSAQTDVHLKENIFTLYVYAKYVIAGRSSAFQPYVIGGLGINSSNIHSEYAINFINEPDKVVLINSGSRSVGLGILARIGADYYLNNKLSIFADAGVGPSILNLGISAHVD